MPELTVTHFGLLALMLVVGLVIGWILRSDRCAKEKIAVNASWQDQLESQQSEHNRLAEQNKSLMEQISQYQASQKDYSNRAKELSESLREAFGRRDVLQRQLKDTRGQLEVAVAQRNRARQELQNNPKGLEAALKEKDDKIFHLSRELTSWQSRVPPLVERFQEKNRELEDVRAELESVQASLEALEDRVKSDQTRIEPVDAETLPDGGDASNEPMAMTSAHDTSDIQDQIDAGDAGEAPESEGIDQIVSVGELPEESGDQSAAIEVNDNFDGVFADSSDDDGEEVLAVDNWAEDDFDEDDDEQEHGSAPEQAINDDDAGEAFGDDDEQNDELPEIATSDEDTGRAAGNGADEDEDRDDLKQIKGIGPSIEKTLNGLGVYRFHQIAEMSEYEIDRVARELRGFRSRIYREDWIGQARDLQYQKENDRS
jgi:NADH-quinone oxidoreductase subunit E